MSEQRLTVLELLLQMLMVVTVHFQPPHKQVILQVTQDAEVVVVHPHLLEKLQLMAEQVLNQDKSTRQQPRLRQVVKLTQLTLMLHLMAILLLIRKEQDHLHLQQVH